MFGSRLSGADSFFNGPSPEMLPLNQLPKSVRDRILLIAGEGEDTKTSIVVQPRGPNGQIRNFFNFEVSPNGDGDGTVPLESATSYKSQVLTLKVKSKLLDKATHSLFLNDGRVQTAIGRFLGPGPKTGQWWRDVADSVQRV